MNRRDFVGTVAVLTGLRSARQASAARRTHRA